MDLWMDEAACGFRVEERSRRRMAGQVPSPDPGIVIDMGPLAALLLWLRQWDF